ncbi:MAG: alpha/beta hydrolase-fold protein [Bryobacteraceae bacterium]|nr:alpha/beta hydrolase-fold protein [Bryobacteraceae bacterium]
MHRQTAAPRYHRPQRTRSLNHPVAALLLFALSLAAAPPPELVPAPAAEKPPEPFVQQTFTLRSEILNETRRVTVALPASFSKTTRSYPVAVVLDGAWILSKVLPGAGELARQGQIPEMVYAAIESHSDPDRRVHDLTPPGLSVSGSSRNEGGDRFLDFIDRELLPALDRQFRTAAPRVLIGMSSGGVLALHAATRPTFRTIVALDPPLQLDDHWLPRRLLARAAAAPAPLHLATLTARFEWRADLWKQLTATAPAPWRVHYEKLANEVHVSMPLLGAYLGLRHVFAPYSKLSAPVFPTTATLPYYDTLAASYGGALPPPEVLLREIVEDLLLEGRAKEARDAFNRLVTAYGEPANAAAQRQKIAEVEKQPPPTETVESLLATPFPTPAEAAHLLGEWKGEDWMNEESRSPFKLRIRVENGKVVGESISHPAPGEEFVRSLEYLKIDGPDAFTYGFRNGMRPRGMLLWEVRREGDTYKGRLRWGGVAFRGPRGDGPPPIYVQLRKSAPGRPLQ